MLGVMRCTCSGCKGTLGGSGQEVTRYICSDCGQNYQIKVWLQPIPPKVYPMENMALPVNCAR